MTTINKVEERLKEHSTKLQAVSNSQIIIDRRISEIEKQTSKILKQIGEMYKWFFVGNGEVSLKEWRHIVDKVLGLQEENKTEKVKSNLALRNGIIIAIIVQVASLIFEIFRK